MYVQMKKKKKLLVLTAAKDVSKSSMIPDSAGDEYAICKPIIKHLF